MSIQTEILEELKTHKLCGQMNKSQSLVAWDWQDLYGPGADSVWKLEIAVTMAGEMVRMALDPGYQKGLLLAVEIVSDDEYAGSPWWYWWSAAEAHRLAQDVDQPMRPILHRAIKEAEHMREWFNDWPEGDKFVLHIRRESERQEPIFVPQH